ncbi:MAG TPA: hypothetical protein DCS07_04280 [Bdellovibrionales bacterium]|nr:MAG: hypothetical protein A2Z97_15750 [Bdellovibrionales bacterium GWB1_52_6]OFZ06434.1 MAG: hypothetical protein A2X97_03165 [Bdellovibrionales bacterium GWA1_52_35]HAR41836.1 hypothetical protein [Bdellovibrionales bacterium]HCM40193.1 hypothetical protein [Bdellovibrionales bacterium]
MRNRPWPLVLLAFMQFMTPVVNILLNSWTLRVKPDVILSWWLQRPALELFESFALMPLAGIAIYLMKRWSYLVFFVALFWNLLSNLKYIDYALNNVPLMISAFYALLNIVLVAYFLLPAVRRTYFDRSIRWWESQPRFEVATPMTLRKGPVVLDGSILNLSQGGAFVKTTVPVALNTGHILEFHILSRTFKVHCKVLHSRDGYAGIQFEHTRKSGKLFADLVKGLELIGFTERNSRTGTLSAFFQGLRIFLKTGKGLIPEVPKKK